MYPQVRAWLPGPRPVRQRPSLRGVQFPVRRDGAHIWDGALAAQPQQGTDVESRMVLTTGINSAIPTSDLSGALLDRVVEGGLPDVWRIAIKRRERGNNGASTYGNPASPNF